MTTARLSGQVRLRAARARTWRRTAPPRLMGHALAAARRGMAVFPLWPRSKTPSLHGRRDCDGTGVCSAGHLGWEQRATTDPDLIRHWWSESPSSNIGVACGPSRIYVLDLDTAHGEQAPEPWTGARHGRDVLAQLAEQAGQPTPATFTVRTPTGGLHLYFRVPADSPLRNTTGRVGWRIDSRGQGGLVVAPGSLRRNGSYTVAHRGPIEPLPAWVADKVAPPLRPEPEPEPLAPTTPLSDIRRRRYLETVCAGVAHAPPRTAHDALVRAAYTLGRLVAGGEFTDDDARASLHIAAHHRRIPAHEADAAVTDGMTAGSRYPRQLEDRN
ncbi:bifunctional DNA primase/polymerase [Actinokineospora iranica]|uniref:Bifunctional DNA primase/polymerase, N-terminal n=1 Tax=Actinokineospora iranica TaxID=1271860 RepID=A0A1G6VRB6_9PSEU|nr:bifunctional DNA primase/polymerase [Actinokineospora iranica]SDD56091.1 Bifunctional DNA primase/polymerase, N-terminal [Actinokineospora iranica]